MFPHRSIERNKGPDDNSLNANHCSTASTGQNLLKAGTLKYEPSFRLSVFVIGRKNTIPSPGTTLKLSSESLASSSLRSPFQNPTKKIALSRAFLNCVDKSRLAKANFIEVSKLATTCSNVSKANACTRFCGR